MASVAHRQCPWRMPSNSTDSILEHNCDGDFSLNLCYVANICGLISTGVWFIVLLPQVMKNYWRRSVVGLSFLWALANFTASLVNLFFVFTVEVPLYMKISAVYMPILELTILTQFFIFHNQIFRRKLLILIVCLLLWGTIVELELTLPQSREDLEWIAIVLWCIESFPQIMLNIKRQSTDGQSTMSVLIALFGKTTDFLSNYGLSVPLEYVIMVYFSSSTSFFNGLQVFWYSRTKWYKKDCTFFPECPMWLKRRFSSGHGDTICNGKPNARALNKAPNTGFEKNISKEDEPLINDGQRDPSVIRSGEISILTIYKKFLITIFIVAGFVYCCTGLCVFVVGLWFRTGKGWWFIAAPVGCVIFLLSVYIYYWLVRGGHLHSYLPWEMISSKFSQLFNFF